MSVIRTIGPFGPSLVRKYTDRRFHYLPPAESQAIFDYLYHICAQPGSGEYALSSILLPGAWGRKPMCNRMHVLKCSVTFICKFINFIDHLTLQDGDHDWMDYEHALKASKKMSVETNVCVVREAGHHVHMG
jgi:cardiolipin-specific phospholipase